MTTQAMPDTIFILTPQERVVFDLLQRNEVATLEQICAALYADFGGRTTSATTRVRVLIPKMREKLRDYGWNIRNVFGFGYSLEERSQRR